MRRCKYTSSWSNQRCWAGGWWFGYCWSHLIRKARVELHLDGRRSGPWFRFSLEDFSLPYVRWDDERPLSYVCVGIGTDGSDPAMEVGFSLLWDIDWSGPLTTDQPPARRFDWSEPEDGLTPGDNLWPELPSSWPDPDALVIGPPDGEVSGQWRQLYEGRWASEPPSG